MRLSKCDRFAVWFALTCKDHGVNPQALAYLCGLTRRAFAAGERECNGQGFADAARERLRVHAASMGWKVDFPGLWPEFRHDGATIRVPG